MSTPTMGLTHNLHSRCTNHHEDIERAVGCTRMILAEPIWCDQPAKPSALVTATYGLSRCTEKKLLFCCAKHLAHTADN